MKQVRFPEVAVIFLNRRCPRSCPYCNSRRMVERLMSLEEWKQAFNVLRNNGVGFFLILGNEPLLLGRMFVDLIQWLGKNKYYYAVYSTSPQPYFDRWKQDLVSAGLRNWSAGVDFIPDVYDSMRAGLSDTCKRLVEESRSNLVEKAVESMAGLRYMALAGVEEVLSLITVSRMNIEMLADMIEWIHKNAVIDRRWKISLNYVEYAVDVGNDFAMSKDGVGSSYYFKLEDEEIWRSNIDRVRLLYRLISEIVIPYSYLDNWDSVVNLNVRCVGKTPHISIDSDGSFRRCGYDSGNMGHSFNVLSCGDMSNMLLAWHEEIKNCPGCYWALPHVAYDDLRFDSLVWIDRYKEDTDE